MSGDPWISAPHRPKAAVTGSFGDRRGNGNDPDRDFLSIGDAWDTVSYLCTKIETQGGGAIHCQCVRSLHMSKNAICDTPRRRHGESPDLTPAFREPRSSSISPRRPDVSRWSWRTAGILIRSGAHRAISPRRAGHVMPPNAAKQVVALPLVADRGSGPAPRDHRPPRHGAHCAPGLSAGASPGRMRLRGNSVRVARRQLSAPRRGHHESDTT